jgi:hypothetical protein
MKCWRSDRRLHHGLERIGDRLIDALTDVGAAGWLESDNVNRPFCAAHAGKVYTKQPIRSMSNGSAWYGKERRVIRVNLIKPTSLQSYNLTRADLLKIGAKTIDTIQKRCSRGQNLNDRPSKPLSARYQAKKERMGQPGIRNEMFSGSLLGSMTIVEADQTHVTVGFTRQAERVKARKNQDRSPWFGISKNDEAVVLRYADQLLQQRARR